MISHAVQLVPVSGRAPRLVEMIEREFIPIIQRFWNTRKDSENFTRSGFSLITDLVKDHVAVQPIRNEYSVDVSTIPRILKKGAYVRAESDDSSTGPESGVNPGSLVATAKRWETRR